MLVFLIAVSFVRGMLKNRSEKAIQDTVNFVIMKRFLGFIAQIIRSSRASWEVAEAEITLR